MSDRREFLQAAGTAAVGAGVLSGFAGSAGAYAGGDDTIRIGVVGCGGRGSGAAVDALGVEGSVKLVAMGDIFGDKLDSSLSRIKKAYADKPGRVDVPKENKFIGFDAIDKVLAAGIDVIILATPPGFRPQHFARAVEAGVHVFMEKPVATDAPGIRTVLAAAASAKEKGLKVGVGLQRRHASNYLETAELIANGDIGDVMASRVYWNSSGVWGNATRGTRENTSTELEYQLRNWYYYSWICGDQICEQHIHNLDIGNWFHGGYPVKARGMGGREVRTGKEFGNIFDHFAVQYEFADGSYMFSECRHIPKCWNRVGESIQGTKGRVDMGAQDARIYFTGGAKKRIKSKKNPYQQEHDDLFAAIRSNLDYNEAEYGAMSTMTSILGRMATYSGQELTMKEALASNKVLVPELTSFENEPPVVPDGDLVYASPRPGQYKAV
ncbi:MAG: Gfo/Idh/MocA family oxidoreductase [Planctomycetota bacterium]